MEDDDSVVFCRAVVMCWPAMGAEGDGDNNEALCLIYVSNTCAVVVSTAEDDEVLRVLPVYMPLH